MKRFNRKNLINILLAGIILLISFFVVKNINEKKLERIKAEVSQEGKKENVQEMNVSENNLRTEDDNQIANFNLDKNIPDNQASFSFAILGDTQYYKSGSGGGYQIAVNSLEKIKPDLVFGIGDLVSSCDETAECEEKLNNWKNVISPITNKPYVSQGNHDRTGKSKADKAWEKVFAYLPDNGPQGFDKFTYSFDFGNSHFVVLDSDKPKENDINKVQLDWLEDDLENNKKENIFVFFHEPAFPTNSKIEESLDVHPKSRDRLWEILNKYKAKGVFSGHEHTQSRSKIDGIYQFIFGNTDAFDHLPPKNGMAEYSYIGQAFGIVKVEGGRITVETYSVDGKILDSFVF